VPVNEVEHGWGDQTNAGWRALAKLKVAARPADEFHALRTRQSGARRFVSFHVLVPGEWTIQPGHALLEPMESELRQTNPHLTVDTHIEPVEDPASWDDIGLDRRRAGR
jgi:divalent metal cation (Fe/Co/Zn/Cd) transporter